MRQFWLVILSVWIWASCDQRGIHRRVCLYFPVIFLKSLFCEVMKSWSNSGPVTLSKSHVFFMRPVTQDLTSRPWKQLVLSRLSLCYSIHAFEYEYMRVCVFCRLCECLYGTHLAESNVLAPFHAYYLFYCIIRGRNWDWSWPVTTKLVVGLLHTVKLICYQVFKICIELDHFN